MSRLINGNAAQALEAVVRRDTFLEAVEIVIQKTRPGTETICYEIAAAIRKLMEKEAKE